MLTVADGLPSQKHMDCCGDRFQVLDSDLQY